MATIAESHRPRVTATDAAIPLQSTGAVRQAYQILHLGFTIAPIVAGADKFLGLLVDWDQYLAPWIAGLSPIGGHNLMLVVGLVAK